MRLRPYRLSRYVLAELTTPTFLGVALFLTLLMLNQIFLIIGDAIQQGQDVGTVVRFIVLYLPSQMVLAVPMGVLLGTLLGVGRLSADNELTALQSAGVGYRFLIRPVLLHGVIWTAVCLFVQGPLIPWASYRIRDLRVEYLAKMNLVGLLKPRVFFDQIPTSVVYAGDIPAGSKGDLGDVFIYQFTNDGEETVYVARRAHVQRNPKAVGSLLIHLEDGVGHFFRSSKPDAYRRLQYQAGLDLEPTQPPPIVRLREQPLAKSSRDMTPADLRRELRDAHNEKEPVVRRYRLQGVLVEIHQRVALSFACLFFAVLAFPLGVGRVRSGKAAGFALSILIILVYYLVFRAGAEQAALTRWPAAPAIWAANGLMAIWAAIAYARLMRARRGDTWVGRLRHVAGIAVRGVASRFRLGRPDASTPDVAERLAAGIEGDSVETPHSASGRRWWIGLLDRYVLGLYLRTLAFVVAFAYVVFILVELQQLLDGLSGHHQPASALLTYFKYFLPGALRHVLPLSCLIAAVVTFTVLGKTGELTAMKAAGISVRRASYPVFAATLGLCAIFFFVQDGVAPETNRLAQATKDRILGLAPRTYGAGIGGRWIGGTQGRVYHYKLYDPERREFQGLTILTIDRVGKRITEHEYAATARWNGKGWDLAKGWRRSFPRAIGEEDAAAAPEYGTFELERGVDLDPPDNFSTRENTLSIGSNDLADQSSVADLEEQIEKLTVSGYDTTVLRVALLSKFARPMTPLIMVLLGLPFAFKVGRKGSMYGVGVALLLVLVYWAAFAVSDGLGGQGVLPPVVAAWAPNVVFALAGGYLMLNVKT